MLLVQLRLGHSLSSSVSPWPSTSEPHSFWSSSGDLLSASRAWLTSMASSFYMPDVATRVEATRDKLRPCGVHAFVKASSEERLPFANSLKELNCTATMARGQAVG
uniref:Uncharacterized protein n=1 Tax=Rhodosorus marinus TaxID=101924 RepID=A0A6T6LLA0_9RHOD